MTPAFRTAGRWRALALLLALGGMLTPTLAPGQDDGGQEARRKALLEGTHVFRRILFDAGFTDDDALKSFDDLTDHPETCILIVLGNLDLLWNVPGGLEQFVRQGGALLAASDRAITLRGARSQLIAVAGVTINNETFLAPGSACYKNLSFCPTLVPLAVPKNAPDLFPPQGSGTLEVATNVPSSLILRRQLPGTVVPLATLPADSQMQLGHGQVRVERTPPLFAVGGEVGRGRVLVMADHSVFINEMMLPKDNNNVEFASNCVDWLRGEKQRTRVLFIEDGRIQEKMNIPLKSVRLPLEEMLQLLFARRNELLVQAEATAARLEEQDFFNTRVFDLLDHIGWPPIRVLAPVAIIATLLAILCGIYLLGIRRRFRHNTAVPLLATTLGHTLPVGPLLVQRADVLAENGNLWEPASALARRWLGRLGIPISENQEPTFEIRAGWWQGRTLRGRLRHLWKLAHGRSAERVNGPQLWRLQRELDSLRAAWERGLWGVAPTGNKTAR